MRSAANTCVRIASTSGISVAAAGADPIGQRRDVELDALAGIGRALPVERQVQAVLGEQHMREQPWPGATARDRMRRRRRLRDALAGAAGELLAHVLDHLPLPRHELQHLGHVLAELVQRRRRSTGRLPGPDRRRARAADARAAGGAPACAARSCAPRPSPLPLRSPPSLRPARRLPAARQAPVRAARAIAPRSEDCPNFSRRSLAIVYLSFSISSARCSASLSAALARASAASNASCLAMIIACAAARSVGSESTASVILLHESQNESTCRVAMLRCRQRMAVNPRRLDATCAAAAASRSLPANSRAAPA